jgi:hypothetical protein
MMNEQPTNIEAIRPIGIEVDKVPNRPSFLPIGFVIEFNKSKIRVSIREGIDIVVSSRHNADKIARFYHAKILWNKTEIPKFKRTDNNGRVGDNEVL